MIRHLRRWGKYLLSGVAIFGLASVTWSLLEPYFLERNVVIAEIPSLPRSWRGKKIAVVADFQIGMPMANTATVARAIDRIVADRPAAALIAGDFVYQPGDDLTPELDRVVQLLRPLVNARIPTYAVLGNHDYGVKTLTEANVAQKARARRIRQKLEAIGVRVLQNEAIVLPNPDSRNDELYLIGIGAYLPEQSRPLEAIAKVPDNAPRLVLMHNPASFATFPPNTAPIAVAGHTHGGQIRIPFLPDWSWMTLVEDKPGWSWISEIQGDTARVSGWIPGYGQAGNHLYINRGIGFSNLPVRFNCRPELTLFILQSETDAAPRGTR